MTNRRQLPPGKAGPLRWGRLFAAVFGVWLGAALLLAGTAIILQPPERRIVWGFILLMVAGLVLGIRNIRALHWTAWLPLGWLGWQGLSWSRSIAPEFSSITLFHFGLCIGAFYVGALFLSRLQNPNWLLIPILLFFVPVLWKATKQHYWEFDQDLRYALEQEKTGWTNEPPEELKDKLNTRFLFPKPEGGYTINPVILAKMEKKRVFGTLMGYPNALAAAILLLCPVLLVVGCQALDRFGSMARTLFAGLFLWLCAACLYWSGSKGGWLIALGVIALVVLHRPIAKNVRLMIAICLIVGGLAAFFVKFTPYFQKGATSVTARFHYWRAAWMTANSNPILGTGPGTFYVSYGKIKPPEAEMARLAHNDYLQQASDSGWIGFLAYLGFVVAVMGRTYRIIPKTGFHFALWLGLLGWLLQGLLEFSLYIPALAWPAFTFMGLLAGLTPVKSNRHLKPLSLP